MSQFVHRRMVYLLPIITLESVVLISQENGKVLPEMQSKRCQMCFFPRECLHLTSILRLGIGLGVDGSGSKWQLRAGVSLLSDTAPLESGWRPQHMNPLCRCPVRRPPHFLWQCWEFNFVYMHGPSLGLKMLQCLPPHLLQRPVASHIQWLQNMHVQANTWGLHGVSELWSEAQNRCGSHVHPERGQQDQLWGGGKRVEKMTVETSHKTSPFPSSHCLKHYMWLLQDHLWSTSPTSSLLCTW